MAMATASDWLVKGVIKKIIISRPAVGMGRTLGLLKGSLEDKFNPYLAPLIEVYTERHGQGKYDIALNSGDLEMIPMEYLRGRNIKDVAIVDEAQNLTQDEMFSLLTRVTEDGKLFLIGDPTQNDLKQESGLVWLERFVEKHELQEFIEIITATSDEIVRGGLCKSFVKAMEKEKN
jgi:phosphate starvation-inducible PhoH-like protein